MQNTEDRYYHLKAEILKGLGLEGRPEDYSFSTIKGLVEKEGLLRPLLEDLKKLRDEICISFFQVVRRRTRRLAYTHNFGVEDIESSAVEALISALDRYSPHKGDFSHYTNRTIKRQIQNGLIKYQPLTSRREVVSTEMEIPDEGWRPDRVLDIPDVPEMKVRQLINRPRPYLNRGFMEVEEGICTMKFRKYLK